MRKVWSPRVALGRISKKPLHTVDPQPHQAQTHQSPLSHWHSSLPALKWAPVAEQAGSEIRIHLGIQFIPYVTLLGLGAFFRQNISNTSQDHCDAGIANGPTEGTPQEEHPPEVDQDHSHSFADVFPNRIQNLQQVLVEERLQDEATEDQDHRSMCPLPKHVPISQKAILHNHVD